MLDEASLNRRLTRLESWAGVSRLIAEYCHGFDQRDIERFLRVWWPDAVWDVGLSFGRLVGRDAIRQLVERDMWPVWREIRHWTSNAVVDVKDDAHASGSSSVLSIGARQDGEAVLISATYQDNYECRDGEWRILERGVTVHFMDPVKGSALTALRA
jgi:gamma-hexachlorocyclohexane dehydrochlorinase